ncbi:HNH endonuclease [Pseudanabaenaceae cyanobacterium LEGE 13415]|nr:HNH endonuclease [Pseudanabaenaceae cyanobacterium LEGE 13415]
MRSLILFTGHSIKELEHLPHMERSLQTAELGNRRRSLSPQERTLVFQKTGGLCHICGGELDNRWTADHIKPVAKGGDNSINNFLPACSTCNRLKWHRSPEAIRLILQIGTYANREIEQDTTLGRQLNDLLQRKIAVNAQRRSQKV